MIQSTVTVSMRDENGLNCSYAFISKSGVAVIVILKDSECGIFDYETLKSGRAAYHYLLLKHYSDNATAYTDFLKLIGKMCKKKPDSKYFLHHKDEDNRMICEGRFDCHTITKEEFVTYQERYNDFKHFVVNNAEAF